MNQHQVEVVLWIYSIYKYILYTLFIQCVLFRLIKRYSEDTGDKVSCCVVQTSLSSDINTTFVALTDLEKKKKKPFNEMSWSVWVNTSEAKAVVTKKRRAISERLIPFS